MKETKNLIESLFLLFINSSVLIFYYFNVNFSERIQDQSEYHKLMESKVMQKTIMIS